MNGPNSHGLAVRHVLGLGIRFGKEASLLQALLFRGGGTKEAVRALGVSYSALILAATK
jgi:hypothetical protein